MSRNSPFHERGGFYLALDFSREIIQLVFITKRQAHKLVQKGLMALGIDKGEHVAIWASNTPEWLTAQFASAKAGAVLVTAN